MVDRLLHAASMRGFEQFESDIHMAGARPPGKELPQFKAAPGVDISDMNSGIRLLAAHAKQSMHLLGGNDWTRPGPRQHYDLLLPFRPAGGIRDQQPDVIGRGGDEDRFFHAERITKRAGHVPRPTRAAWSVSPALF